ncbi:MAG: MTAP family purine nucleoside phosphorylase [bacterium]
MGRLGLIAGSSLGDAEAPAGAWERLNRHQAGAGYVLPHRIDHEANLRRLLDAGCDRVLAVGSVGGLQPQLGPGTFVSPDDFIALHLGLTALGGPEAHTVPGFGGDWRRRVVQAWAQEAEPPLVDGGVYWQTIGPRLETAAEIRMIARDADVLGMTIASECLLAGELGLAYAAVCIVDNYANGVGDEPLRISDLEAGRDANLEGLEQALASVLPALA